MESVPSSILLNCLPALFIPEPHPGSANQGASVTLRSSVSFRSACHWPLALWIPRYPWNVEDLVLLEHPLAICCLSPGRFPKSVEEGAASHPVLGAEGRIS